MQQRSRSPVHVHPREARWAARASAATPSRQLDLVGLQRIAGNRAVVRARARQRQGDEPVIQRITAAELQQAGNLWHAEVWIKGNYTNRDIIIGNFNNWIAGTGFTLRRGWQPYDPVIRPARKYTDIATQLDNNAVANANSFLQFLDGTIQLAALNANLAELALITCFAEVARGYGSSISTDLTKWVTKVSNGTKTWSQVKAAFAPALTYQEDAAKEFGT